MDCEDHVVPPVKFLEPYDSNQSAASLTLHENDAVHVQLTSAVLAHRRQTAKKKDHPNLLPVFEVALEQRTAMHRVWVASTDDGVDAETSLSLSLHLYLSSPPLHFILTLTFGQ